MLQAQINQKLSYLSQKNNQEVKQSGGQTIYSSIIPNRALQKSL